MLGKCVGSQGKDELKVLPLLGMEKKVKVETVREKFVGGGNPALGDSFVACALSEDSFLILPAGRDSCLQGKAEDTVADKGKLNKDSK